MFLEWRNPTKSIFNIWQYFSCLLDEGIPKICKKLNCHGGFLSCLQNSTANSAHMTTHFCPVLICPQKPLREFNFFHIFEIPSSSRPELCWPMLERLFVLFYHSRNIPLQLCVWAYCIYFFLFLVFHIDRRTSWSNV